MVEVAVDERRKVGLLGFGLTSEGLGDDGESVRNTVLGVPVGHLSDGVERSESAGAVTSVHGVGSGGESLTLLATVGSRAGLLAVDDVGSDGKDGERVLGVAVRLVDTELAHEAGDDVLGDHVNLVVVVTVLRELTNDVKVDSKTSLVADGSDLGVLDGGEGVSNDGETGDTESKEATDLSVVKSHLDLLVAVLVMHEVDGVHGVDVDASEPVHGLVVAGEDPVEIERALGGRLELGADLGAGDLVLTSVEDVEEELGKVATGTKELHLLADAHGRHAAGDGIILTETLAHHGVILVLDRRGLDRGVSAELLEVNGELVVPEDGKVRFGGRAEVVKSLEHTERGLGDHRLAVEEATTEDASNPGWVSSEEVVVGGGTEMTAETELDDELIDELLSLRLGDGAGGEVLLNVDIEESVNTAERHSSTVLFADGAEVTVVGPCGVRKACKKAERKTQLRQQTSKEAPLTLDGLTGGGSGLRDVVTVGGSHFLELLEGTDLYCKRRRERT